jgi:hypothetical protein
MFALLHLGVTLVGVVRKAHCALRQARKVTGSSDDNNESKVVSSAQCRGMQFAVNGDLSLASRDNNVHRSDYKTVSVLQERQS